MKEREDNDVELNSKMFAEAQKGDLGGKGVGEDIVKMCCNFKMSLHLIRFPFPF